MHLKFPGHGQVCTPGLEFPSRAHICTLGLEFPSRARVCTLGLEFPSRAHSCTLGLEFPIASRTCTHFHRKRLNLHNNNVHTHACILYVSRFQFPSIVQPPYEFMLSCVSEHMSSAPLVAPPSYKISSHTDFVFMQNLVVDEAVDEIRHADPC